MNAELVELGTALARAALRVRPEPRVAARHARFLDYFARWRRHSRAPEVVAVLYGDDVVATAVVGRGGEQGFPGAAVVRVDVREDWRGRGLGRRLATHVEWRARALGADELQANLWVGAREEHRFAASRGLRERSRVDRWRLDLAAPVAARAAPALAAGVSLRSYAELRRDVDGDRLDAMLAALHRHIHPSLPRPVTPPRLGALAYREIYLRNAHFCPEATFIAFRGDEPLGLTLTLLDRGVAWSVVTGTADALRSSHVGRALKLAVAERLRTLGATRLVAMADTDNAPLRGTLTSLGYVRESSLIRYARRLRRASTR